MVTPIIFQVVGYQNSGKTTFLLKLIQTFKSQGLKVVTIKHHGHGGKPDAAKEKDSARHLESGALAACVEGEGRLVLQAEDSGWSLDEQLKLMEYFHPDVILIEGYKQERFPKLVFVKNESDFSILSTVDNIKGFISWDRVLLKKIREQLEVPAFHIDDKTVVTQISQSILELVDKID